MERAKDDIIDQAAALCLHVYRQDNQDIQRITTYGSKELCHQPNRTGHLLQYPYSDGFETFSVPWS